MFWHKKEIGLLSEQITVDHLITQPSWINEALLYTTEYARVLRRTYFLYCYKIIVKYDFCSIATFTVVPKAADLSHFWHSDTRI